MTTAQLLDLSALIGEPVAGAHRRERRFPGAYESWILDVELESGAELALFVKDLNSCPDFKDDRRERHERELFMYRDVLSSAELGTARFYGYSGGLLVLEFVDGMPVRYCDIPHWLDAARWLGRMQAVFAPRAGELRASGRLAVYDSSFYRSAYGRARGSVSEFSSSLAERLDRALGNWDAAAEAMAGAPSTLVHSAYRPAEILTVGPPGGARICPVDWELAAVGSTLFDIAMLTDGFEGEELERFLEVHREAAAEHGWDVPTGAEARFVLDCHRIHKHLTLLAHASRRGYSAADTEAILTGVEAMAASALG